MTSAALETGSGARVKRAPFTILLVEDDPTDTELMLHAIEQATGKAFTDAERAALVQAPDELSIVNSGLEETMVTAYQEIRETLQRQPAVQDLRTAAFLNAINKVARAYVELGVFP